MNLTTENHAIIYDIFKSNFEEVLGSIADQFGIDIDTYNDGRLVEVTLRLDDTLLSDENDYGVTDFSVPYVPTKGLGLIEKLHTRFLHAIRHTQNLLSKQGLVGHFTIEMHYGNPTMLFTSVIIEPKTK